MIKNLLGWKLCTKSADCMDDFQSLAVQLQSSISNSGTESWQIATSNIFAHYDVMWAVHQVKVQVKEINRHIHFFRNHFAYDIHSKNMAKQQIFTFTASLVPLCFALPGSGSLYSIQEVRDTSLRKQICTDYASTANDLQKYTQLLFFLKRTTG